MPAGRALLRVLPNTPYRSHSAATAGRSLPSPLQLAATPCSTLSGGGQALVRCADFLWLSCPIFPACLPRHGSPMDFLLPLMFPYPPQTQPKAHFNKKRKKAVCLGILTSLSASAQALVTPSPSSRFHSGVWDPTQPPFLSRSFPSKSFGGALHTSWRSFPARDGLCQPQQEPVKNLLLGRCPGVRVSRCHGMLSPGSAYATKSAWWWPHLCGAMG